MAEHEAGGGYDRESVDRAFAELVAGWHLTADRPGEPRPVAELTATEEPPVAERITSIVLPPPVPVVRARPAGPRDSEAPNEPADEPYLPSPLPPLARPGAPALVGWVGVLFAAVVVLAAGFGLTLPDWVGWTAVACFIVGSVVLLTQLPRHRPPGAGDGAVL